MDRDAENHRRTLEQQADIIRARLSATLSELDRRRKDFFNLRLQARRHPLPALSISAFAVVSAAAGGAFTIYEIWRLFAARRTPLRRLVRVLRHPERLLPRQQPSLMRRIFSSALAGAASALAGVAVRRVFALPEHAATPVAPATGPGIGDGYQAS